MSPYQARRQPLIERKEVNHNNVDENLDSSEFSAVESFTQTQYSKWSKFGGKSNIFPRVQGDSIELNDDISMKKSPNVQRFRNMDGDESLSLTPCSQDGLTS